MTLLSCMHFYLCLRLVSLMSSSCCERIANPFSYCSLVILILTVYRRFHTYRGDSNTLVRALYNDGIFYIVPIICGFFSADLFRILMKFVNGSNIRCKRHRVCCPSGMIPLIHASKQPRVHSIQIQYSDLLIV